MFMNQKAVVQEKLLTAAAADYYVAPANTVSRLSSVTFTNQDVEARTVTVHLIKAGATAGPANRVVNAYVIGIGETWTCPHLNHNLNPGDKMQAMADVAAKVSVYGSVIEMSKAG